MLLAWFVFSFLAYQFCILPACCGEGSTAGAAAAAPLGATDSTAAGRRYAIDTRYGDAEVFTNTGFDALRDRWARELSSDANKRLEITGLYYESEPKPDDYDNLGFARATRIRDLLAEELPPDRIQIRARALEDTEGMRQGYFEAAVYDLETSAPAEAGSAATEDATVEELEDRIIVRFPFNDARKELNPEVDTYIQRLAQRLQSTRERVRIVGHTDNVGDEAFNQRLGLQRAEFVKNELVQLGVEPARISTESRGETQPVDSNETETGRSNNRRAELRLLPANQ